MNKDESLRKIKDWAKNNPIALKKLLKPTLNATLKK